ncbi:hypothetical protein KIM322_08340 [Lactobacillus xylocopicola]|uniref:Uncharacterized protein n=1 Tax=Lactobacillus xylocopicola TaxID=2976676 RepID=A0ABN6SLP5_9LACO|nr:hypothetical protein KIM322_08340 [Lactobacillus xylocopicola]
MSNEEREHISETKLDNFYAFGTVFNREHISADDITQKIVTDTIADNTISI